MQRVSDLHHAKISLVYFIFDIALEDQLPTGQFRKA